MGANQWTWPCAFTHMDTIMVIAETKQARLGYVSLFVAFLYDERRRKVWYDCIEHKDRFVRSFDDLLSECCQEDRYILDESKLKVLGRMGKAR